MCGTATRRSVRCQPVKLVIPTWIVGNETGGTTTFLTSLLVALSHRDDVQLRLLCSRQSVERFDELRDLATTEIEVTNVPGPPAARPMLEQWMARHIDHQQGDVLVVPSDVGFLRASIPQIVVVQSPLALPTIRRESAHLVRSNPLRRTYHRLCMGPTLRRADAVVAVSNWLRGHILRSYPSIDPDRVHVIYEGVDHPPPCDRTDPPSADRDHRILFVSTLYPYKGATELIDALGALASRRPDLPWTCRLVGPDPAGGTTLDALSRQADLAGIGDRVELTGFIPRSQVWSEYRTAGVFVYPSRLETFGLPPLEAMAAGTPVVASNAASVGEVVGDAALTVDPTDAVALGEALATVLTSAPTRERLVAAGRQRAAELSWDATADAFVGLAHEVARDPR